MVQRQMRHATIQMTLDCYAHLLPGTLEETIEQFDEAILGKPTEREEIADAA